KVSVFGAVHALKSEPAVALTPASVAVTLTVDGAGAFSVTRVLTERLRPESPSVMVAGPTAAGKTLDPSSARMSAMPSLSSRVRRLDGSDSVTIADSSRSTAVSGSTAIETFFATWPAENDTVFDEDHALKSAGAEFPPVAVLPASVADTLRGVAAG